MCYAPKELAETTEEKWTFEFELEGTSCSLLRQACNSRKHKVSEAEVLCQQTEAALRRGAAEDPARWRL